VPELCDVYGKGLAGFGLEGGASAETPRHGSLEILQR